MDYQGLPFPYELTPNQCEVFQRLQLNPLQLILEPDLESYMTKRGIIQAKDRILVSSYVGRVLAYLYKLHYSE